MGTSTLSGANDVAMGKEDFLTLLVAQLQNQDPLNPSDPTEFTAQLAQFSQLEQLTNVNESLEGLTTMSSAVEQMSALGLIGQDIIVQSEQFHFSGEAMELGYRLAAPADDVKLYVLSETGSTLATLTAEETGAGEYFVDWDGNGDLDLPLEAGDYYLVVRAVDEEDRLVEAEGLLKGRVAAVDMSGNETQLETDSGTFAMSRLTRVGEPDD
jgi:flagellar basal-body rod modification protein FlgD